MKQNEILNMQCKKKEGVKCRPPQFSHTKAEWSEGDALQSAQFHCILLLRKWTVLTFHSHRGLGCIML